MILAYVLWSMTLLSTIAVSVLMAGTTTYQILRNGSDFAQAEAAAQSAVNLAVLGLLDRRLDRRWRVDGTARAVTFGGLKVRVTVQDELGRIDLNHADAPLLIGLLTSAGMDKQAAAQLVDKIQDWRDSSSLRRLNGAKSQDYAAAGLAHRPRNGPFQSVDELKLVM